MIVFPHPAWWNTSSGGPGWRKTWQANKFVLLSHNCYCDRQAEKAIYRCGTSGQYVVCGTPQVYPREAFFFCVHDVATVFDYRKNIFTGFSREHAGVQGPDLVNRPTLFNTVLAGFPCAWGTITLSSLSPGHRTSGSSENMRPTRI